MSRVPFRVESKGEKSHRRVLPCRHGASTAPHQEATSERMLGRGLASLATLAMSSRGAAAGGVGELV